LVGAILRGGGGAHDLDVGAQPAVEHPGEGMRQEHRRGWRWRLDHVHVRGDDLVALLGGWQPHHLPKKSVTAIC